MIKGALFTLGILAAIGGFGFAAFGIFAAGMSDNPSAAAEQTSEMALPAGIGVVGIVMIIVAVFL